MALWRVSVQATLLSYRIRLMARQWALVPLIEVRPLDPVRGVENAALN